MTSSYLKRIIVSLAIGAFFSVLMFAVYRPALENGFVFDDINQVTNNPWITSFSHIREIFTSYVWGFEEFRSADKNGVYYYRPLMHIIFVTEYYFFGLNVKYWHMVNIVWHAINAILVFFVALRMLGRHRFLPIQTNKSFSERTRKYSFAFIAGTIFCMYPINSEAVNWISAIPELSYTSFLLLSLLTFFSPRRFFQIVIAPLFFFFALLCKESAVLFPLLLFIVDVFIFEKEKGVRQGAWLWLKKSVGFVFILVVYFLMRPKTSSDTSTVLKYLIVLLDILTSGPAILWHSLVHLVFPFRLSFVRDFSRDDWLNMAIAGVSYSAVLVYAYRVLIQKIATAIPDIAKLGGVFIVVPMIPTFSAFFLGVFSLSERYLYFSSIGIALLWAFIADSIIFRSKDFVRIAGVTCMVFFVAGYIEVSYHRSLVWKNTETLLNDAKRQYAQTTFLYEVLGDHYAYSGDSAKYQGLIASLKQEVSSQKQKDALVALRYADAYNALSDKNTEIAIARYNVLIRAADASDEKYISKLYRDLGVAYVAHDESENAEAYLLWARELNPQGVSIARTLAQYYCFTGDTEKAEHYFMDALRNGDTRERILVARECCADKDFTGTFVRVNKYPL
jgi:hypothetical protein